MSNQTVKTLYSILHGLGIQGVIAGGAARCELHGKPIKDYDFIVFGLNYDEVHRKLVNDDVYIDAEYSEAYGNTERFQWCIKVEIEGVAVDLIGVAGAYNVQTAIDSFDFGINHCYFAPDGVAHPGGWFPRRPGDLVVVLHRAELTIERCKRFMREYPQYDWNIAIDLSLTKPLPKDRE